jgi:hypothetical protein
MPPLTAPPPPSEEVRRHRIGVPKGHDREGRGKNAQDDIEHPPSLSAQTEAYCRLRKKSGRAEKKHQPNKYLCDKPHHGTFTPMAILSGYYYKPSSEHWSQRGILGLQRVFPRRTKRA